MSTDTYLPGAEEAHYARRCAISCFVLEWLTHLSFELLGFAAAFTRALSTRN